jgi:hypothetical protein
VHDHAILNALLRIEARLSGIEAAIFTEGTKTMSALDDLTTQVAKNTSLEASAIQLIQGLAAQLAAAATDPAKVTALSAQLSTSATALAAAITANTPAAPPAPAPAPSP